MGTSAAMFPLILLASMSEVCLEPAEIPQCWLSNSTAQAMAWIRVNPDVLVLIPFSCSHLSLVTCLATRECLDWMVGKGPLVSAAIGFHLPESPPEKALSSFHRVLTPSIIFWTSSTSEYPSLCLLEMS